MSRPIIVAHRGYSAIAPENTIAALEAAIQAGARACEVDLRLSRDGHVVLMHDATLDRTTTGSGPVREATLAQLQALDAGSWKDARYAGESVPSLAQALEAVANRAHLVLEIKEPDIAPIVADVITKADAADHVTIISFDIEACRAMRELMPEVGALWLVGGDPRPPAELARRALRAGLQGIDAHHSIADEAMAETLHIRGLSLWAWTVNDAGRARELAAMGVEAITTDKPPNLFAALQ